MRIRSKPSKEHIILCLIGIILSEYSASEQKTKWCRKTFLKLWRMLGSWKKKLINIKSFWKQITIYLFQENVVTHHQRKKELYLILNLKIEEDFNWVQRVWKRVVLRHKLKKVQKDLKEHLKNQWEEQPQVQWQT